MRRRAPDERIAEFRERDAAAIAEPIRERIEAWTEAHHDALAAARPAMPDGVRDRPAEVWEALLAIADAAGGDWPQRARAACRHFVLGDGAEERLSLGLRLLRDVRIAFGDLDAMFSVNLLSELLRDELGEWGDLWGKPLDARRLAKELGRYGVVPKDVRIGSMVRKGYTVAGDTGLAQAWQRYLPPAYMGDSRNNRDIAGQPVAPVLPSSGERDKGNTGATAETRSEVQRFQSVAAVAAVADTDGLPPESDAADEGCCARCRQPIPVHMRSARARGICSRCVAQADSKGNEVTV